jgi:hypothetical protein
MLTARRPNERRAPIGSVDEKSCPAPGQKYFPLDILLIRSSVGRPAPLKRGASRSSRTLGRDAMDAAASGAFCARRLRLTRTAEGIWLNPGGPPPALCFAGGPGVAATTRHALRPRFRGWRLQSSGAKSRRENTKPYPLCCLTFNSETIASVRPSLHASDATLRASSEILLFRRRARHESPKQAPEKAKPLHCLFSRSPAHFRGRNSLARTSWHKASYPIRPASRIWRRRCRHQAPRSG